MFFRWKSGLPLASVTDGLSNTWMLGEDLPEQNFHNTAFGINLSCSTTSIPLNLRLPRNEWPRDGMSDSTLHSTNRSTHSTGFKSLHFAGAQFAMGDGSVRFVYQGIDYRTYNQLGTRAGAEVAQPE
jgi:hypothetical protein